MIRLSDVDMKTKILILLTAVLANPAFGQSTFRNLNFEETTLPYSTNPMGFVSAAQAFPGWTVYYGNAPQTQVVYNGVISPPAIVIWNGDYAAIPPRPASFGAFSPRLSPTTSVPLGVSLAQVGTIPEGVNSLSFETFSTFFNGTFQVSFGGNVLPLQPVAGPTPSRISWFADLTGLSGRTDELRISGIHFENGAGSIHLDNVQFLSIPEPRAWVLGLAGTALLLAARRRRV